MRLNGQYECPDCFAEPESFHRSPCYSAHCPSCGDLNENWTCGCITKIGTSWWHGFFPIEESARRLGWYAFSPGCLYGPGPDFYRAEVAVSLGQMSWDSDQQIYAAVGVDDDAIDEHLATLPSPVVSDRTDCSTSYGVVTVRDYLDG